MKKITRNLIALLLAASMLASFCLVFAQDDYSGYVKYTALGDSIANGIGENNVDNKYMNRTPGAYPDRIANAIGAELKQLGCGGMRSVELRACIEDGYNMPDEFANNFSRAKVAEIRHFYVPAIEEADLITLNIGANDIATYALLKAKAAAAKEHVCIDSAIADLEAKGEYTAALVAILDAAKTVSKYVGIVNAAIEGLFVGYARFSDNFDAIIRDIYKLNPDVTLMVAGFYNPFAHLKLSDSSLLELGKAADIIIEMLNLKIKCGSAYSSKYIFVDIMGIESMASKFGDSLLDDGFFQSVELNVHPSNEGQAEIAARFMKVLPKTPVSMQDKDGSGLGAWLRRLLGLD